MASRITQPTIGTETANGPVTGFTSFDGHCCIAQGSLADNALALKRAQGQGRAGPWVTLDDHSGLTVDLDLRGTEADVLARLPALAALLAPKAAGAEACAGLSPVPEGQAPVAADAGSAPSVARRGRGRPRLGVVAREVTLLPRHWEWLAEQPGGASVALRKLVELARRQHAGRDRQRAAQARAYAAMATLAAHLAGFEEASRALFAGDPVGWATQARSWPEDVQAYIARLAWPDAAAGAPAGSPAEPAVEVAAHPKPGH